MANERRMIDADKILKFCEDGLNNPNPTKAFGHDAIEIMAEIQCAPTVDAVEVVRCKDCKHYFHYGKTSILVDGKNMKCGWCQRRTRYDEELRMLPDDFCSYGEKGGTQPQREDV